VWRLGAPRILLVAVLVAAVASAAVLTSGPRSAPASAATPAAAPFEQLVTTGLGTATTKTAGGSLILLVSGAVPVGDVVVVRTAHLHQAASPAR